MCKELVNLMIIVLFGLWEVNPGCSHFLFLSCCSSFRSGSTLASFCWRRFAALAALCCCSLLLILLAESLSLLVEDILFLLSECFSSLLFRLEEVLLARELGLFSPSWLFSLP